MNINFSWREILRLTFVTTLFILLEGEHFYIFSLINIETVRTLAEK